MDFLKRNTEAIQALAAVLTVLLALGALLGVKVQIDSSDAIQRAQSARDIYREFLALSVNKPEFAQPDYCKIADSANAAAYESYFEYFLYTAEQVLESDAAWTPTVMHLLEDHQQFACTIKDKTAYSDSVAAVLQTFQEQSCKSVEPCK